ncbi:MAG: hypothetical protein H6850_02550 [Alphaproteobacteria bacterium]|nr:MAG: hypothetical protein H6850_02550 [Alphaproteobacteria bacterium]
MLFLFADAVAKKVEYFAATNTKKVQRFKGPGTNYPLMHILSQKNYPVKVIGEFDNWCRVLCVDGELGWIKKCYLSTKYRRAITIKNTHLYDGASNHSRTIAQLHKNVFVQIKSTKGEFAYVMVGEKRLKGFVPLKDLW